MRDPVLEMIVSLSEDQESPLEAALTLVVGGFLVSGHLISKRNFFEQNPITQAINIASDRISAENEHSEEPEDDGKRRYIHLRDARYFQSGGPPIPGNGGVFCRIKLTDVSGFHFGFLSTAPED